MRALAAPARRLDPGAIAVGGAAILLPGSAAAAASLGYELEVLLALLVGGALVIGLARWRWALAGLLAFVPLAGIVTVAAYPETGTATLLKDFVFVVPAYVGFAAYALRRGLRITFSGAPNALFLLLTVLVVGQAANPDLPSLFVGAIGMKVWLLYLPLYYLGYHFVETVDDLKLLLRIMCLGAVIPVVVGLVEAGMIYGGSPERVYALYGDAAASVTQQFASIQYPGGGSLRRVPSTFSFVTQYFGFLLSMTAVAYAWWRFAPAGARGRNLRLLLWLSIVAAAFLSGARVAALFVPLLVALMIALDLRGRPFGPLLLVAVVGGFFVAAAVIGTTAAGAVEHTVEVARHEFHSIFVGGFAHAFETTWAGMGTGSDTNATRYAFSDRRIGSQSGTWFESWHVKVILELGVAGVAVVASLFAMIVSRAVRAHRRLQDPALRATSAALIAFLVVAIVAGAKGQYLDIDPMNVYFWLLAGVLPAVARLDAERRPALEHAG